MKKTVILAVLITVVIFVTSCERNQKIIDEQVNNLDLTMPNNFGTKASTVETGRIKFVLRHRGNDNCVCPDCKCPGCKCPLGMCICGGLVEFAGVLTKQEIQDGYGTGIIYAVDENHIAFEFEQQTALENSIVPIDGEKGDYFYIDKKLAEKIGLKSDFIIQQGEFEADFRTCKFGKIIVPIEYIK